MTYVWTFIISELKDIRHSFEFSETVMVHFFESSDRPGWVDMIVDPGVELQGAREVSNGINILLDQLILEPRNY